MDCQQVAVALVIEGKRFIPGVGGRKELAAGVVAVAARLPGGISNRQWPVLRVVGGLEEQFVFARPRHADLLQINAVGGVNVRQGAAQWINGIGDAAKAIVAVRKELGGTVIEHTADLRWKIV